MQILKAFVFIALPLAVAGCEHPDFAKPQDRIELRTSEIVRGFSFAGGATQLSGSEQSRLRDLLRQSATGPKDRVVISLPSGATTEGTLAREAHLRRLLAPYGAQVEIVTEPAQARRAGVQSQGLIRIVKSDRMEIHCPAHSEQLTKCATSRNLAVMLDDPNDLIFPRVLPEGEAMPSGPRLRGSGSATATE